MSDSKLRNWFVKLLSDGSDKDAGNGPVDLSKTVWWWSTADMVNNNKATAGKTKQVIVELKTKENLRLNDWLDGDNVVWDFEQTLANLDNTYKAVRGSKPGQYSLNVNLKKVAVRTFFLKANDVRTRIKGTIEVVPAAAFKGYILDDSLKAKGTYDLKDTVIH